MPHPIAQQRSSLTESIDRVKLHIPLQGESAYAKNAGLEVNHEPWPAVSMTSMKLIRSSTRACLRYASSIVGSYVWWGNRIIRSCRVEPGGASYLDENPKHVLRNQMSDDLRRPPKSCAIITHLNGKCCFAYSSISEDSDSPIIHL